MSTYTIINYSQILKYFLLFIFIFIGLCLVQAQPTDPTLTIVVDGGTPEVVVPNPGMPEEHPIRICTGKEIEITASSTGTGTITYKLKNTDNSATFNFTNNVYTAALPSGQYVVLVEDESGTGEVTSSIRLVVCVETSAPSNAQIITMTGATTVCTADASCGGGNSLTLIASATNNVSNSNFCPTDDEFTYVWYKDEVLMNGETSETLTITKAGDYAVYVSNTCGQSAPASFTVTGTTSAPEDVEVVAENNTTTIAEGESVTLYSQAQGVVNSYQWYRDNVKLSGENSSSLTITTTTGDEGTYSYTVEAINGCDATTSNALDIVVEVSDPTQTPDTYSLINFSVCGTDGDFTTSLFPTPTISTINGERRDITRIEWYKDGALVDTYETPFINGTKYITQASGEYFIRTYNVFGGFTESSKITVSIPASTVQIVSTSGTILNSCNSNSINLELVGYDANGGVGKFDASAAKWYKDGVYDSSLDGLSSISVTGTGTYRAEKITNSCLTDPDTLSSGDIIITSSTPIAVSGITPVLSADASNCTGTSITLTVKDAGNNDFAAGVTYIWQKDGVDFTTTTTNTYTLTSGNDNEGTFRVKVRNSCGEESGFSNELERGTYEALPGIEIEAVESTSICGSGGMVTLQLKENPALTSRSEVSYEWFKDSLPIGGTNTTSYQVTTAGMYSLEVSVQGVCTQMSTEIMISEITEQTLTVDLFQIPCADPVTLEASVTGEVLEYQWYIKDVTDPTNCTASYQATGDNTSEYQPDFEGANVDKVYEVIVGISNGCPTGGFVVFSEPVTVTQNTSVLPEVVTVTLADTGEDGQICSGEEVRLAANFKLEDNVDENSLSYRWYKDQILQADKTEKVITVNEPGDYEVELFVNECSRFSLAYPVSAHIRPILLLTTIGSVTFCEGDSLNTFVQAQIEPIQYEWYKDGDLLVENVESYTITEAGTYQVKAIYDETTGQYPCQDIVESDPLDVTTVVAPNPEINLIGGALVASSALPLTYQWNFQGTPILDAHEFTYVPLDSGSYSVTVTNEFGCFGVSNTIEHAGTYLESNDPLIISPNPNQGIFRVMVVGEGEISISVYDELGQEIMSKKTILKQNSISAYHSLDFSGLEPGVYLLKSESSSQTVTKKLIVY